MEILTEQGLLKVLQLFENGDPQEAQALISSLFEGDLDCKELIYTNRCCTFWIDIMKQFDKLSNNYEKGNYILTEWKTILPLLSKEIFIYEPALSAFTRGYFANALKHFLLMLDDKEVSFKAEAYKNAGLCYKRLGDYENARNCLSEANNLTPNNAAVLAELADCYALCGKDRFAKVLFREAFFLDPEIIDLDFLDSELIKCLIAKTEKKGYTGKVLQHWIPVYGIIEGIFNIKRALNSREVCKLNQNIYALENEYKDPSCNGDILVPTLLNDYFWLIDHYVMTKEDISKINKILIKIKIIDASIYDLYI